MNISIKYNLFTFSLNDGWREIYTRRKYNPKNKNERLSTKKLNVNEKKNCCFERKTQIVIINIGNSKLILAEPKHHKNT